MADGFVLIHEFHGDFRAQEFVELLASEGIVASAPGLMHRGMLGMVGTYVTVPVRVPRADEARARELLAFLQEDVEEDEVEFDADAPGSYREAAAQKRTELPRRRRIALFAGIVFPFGGGHFYARAYPSGWLLLWLSVMGVYAILNRSVPVAFTYVPLAVVAFDLIASGKAVRDFNEETPRSAFAQAALALPAVALLTYAFYRLGIWLEPPQ
ncbi:MAG: hypothetical protein AAF645_01125 [Myxococcota bacterium]